MRYSHVLGAAVVGLAATAANAGMTVSLVPVSTAGSGISGTVRSFDLRVTTDSGTKWSSADLQFTLASTGSFAGTSFYNLASGDSNIATLAGAGSLDTGVAVPAGGNGAAILGKAQYPVESGIGSAVFPSTAAPGTAVDAAWGDTGANNFAVGSATIARFTVVGTGGAYLNGRVGATNNSIAPVTFSNLYLPILGDVDGDGIVGTSDIAFVKSHAGTTPPAGTIGDVDFDGIVGTGDIAIVKSRAGTSLPAPGAALGAVVPEPASLSLLGAMGLLALGRKRRA